ncbi:MAG: hypothetical protein WBV64_16930, partial [Mycobacterium sp.]
GRLRGAVDDERERRDDQDDEDEQDAVHDVQRTYRDDGEPAENQPAFTPRAECNSSESATVQGWRCGWWCGGSVSAR